MQIPVLQFALCSGTGPDDPALRVHGAFTTEVAARNVMKAVIGEKGAGTLILAPGTDVFVVPQPAVIEAADFPAAVAAGYTIDFSRLAYQAPKEDAAPEPVALPDATEDLGA